MSLRLSSSVAPNPSFGGLGFFSVGVIAFALATLQGCAPPSVTSASAKEPGGVSLPSLGSLRADEAPRPEHHRAADHTASDRAAARPLTARSMRPEYCRRCTTE
jgi:hypothetical protein